MGAATMAGDMQGMAMCEHAMTMMAHLAALSGPRLEAFFLVMMIPHHQDAMAMAELAAGQAAHAELKALAQAIITSQSAEIDQMNRWLAEWYSL
jgi:uncharacterized protein (DUF305 family)